jgi:hypothetical protein
LRALWDFNLCNAVSKQGNGKGGVKEWEGELGSKVTGDLEGVKKRWEGRDRG